MKIIKAAVVGTLESSNLMVKVSPSPDAPLAIVVNSEVMRRFPASTMTQLDGEEKQS